MDRRQFRSRNPTANAVGKSGTELFMAGCHCCCIFRAASIPVFASLYDFFVAATDEVPPHNELFIEWFTTDKHSLGARTVSGDRYPGIARRKINQFTSGNVLSVNFEASGKRQDAVFKLLLERNNHAFFTVDANLSANHRPVGGCRRSDTVELTDEYLCAETAAGKFPLETVEEMAKICAAAESAEHVELDADFMGQTFDRIDQTIAMGALFTAHHMGAKAIVALTESGSTALWMSRHRVHIPIYALTTKVSAQRRMALFRNVRPLLMDTSADRDTALAQAEGHLKKRGIVSTGDAYAITCGEPMGTPGGTNMLKICRVG